MTDPLQTAQYDTLLNANNKEMLFLIPPHIEPESPFCMIGLDKEKQKIVARGQYRLTTYTKANLATGAWKEIPSWA